MSTSSFSASGALYAIATIMSRDSSNLSDTSLNSLPSELRNGMIAMGLIGLLSFLSTFGLFLFITYRMIYWQRYYESPISSHQLFILIYNLLLADMQQALSFLMSFHWLYQNGITPSSRACFAQGWLIQIGDVSSGIWVLAIAIHTFMGLVAQRMIPKRLFIFSVLFIWAICLVLTAIGPIVYKDNFFVPSGAWCWINEEYQTQRLCLHYIWIFGSQLGSLIIYGVIFIILRRRLRILSDHPLGPNLSSTTSNGAPFGTYKNETSHTVTTVITTNDPFGTSCHRISRAARYMIAYPLVYVALTLPLAAGRVSAMLGNSPSVTYYCVSGAMMASCGVIDVLLYISTRKALLKTSVGVKPNIHTGAVNGGADALGVWGRLRLRFAALGGGGAGAQAMQMGDLSANKGPAKTDKMGGIGGIMVSRRFSTSDDTSLEYSVSRNDPVKPGSQRRLVLRDGDDFESV